MQISKFDDLCGYTTFRTVKLRDWRLGVLYHCLLFIVVSYIVGYNIVYQQLYRKSVAIVGTSRIQLRAADINVSTPANKSNFCGKSYVSHSSGLPNIGDTYPCKFWDNFDSVFPSLEESGAFLTSRVTLFEQQLPEGCEKQQERYCEYKTVRNSTFFLLDVEFSTALIDHMVIARQIGISRASLAMSGNLLSADGERIDPCDDYRAFELSCPATVKLGVPGQPDIVPIKTILRAAGISSLDNRAGLTDTQENETLRYSGLVVILSIEYSNYFARTGSWSEDTVAYTYRATAVPASEFKGEEILPGPGAGGLERMILDRHGIRLVVRQAGVLGAFDVAALLVTLTSAVGLLAVANACVDLLATTILPHRAVYAQYMQVQTVGLGQLPREALEAFRERDLVNPPPALPDLRSGLLGDAGPA